MELETGTKRWRIYVDGGGFVDMTLDEDEWVYMERIFMSPILSRYGIHRAVFAWDIATTLDPPEPFRRHSNWTPIGEKVR